MPATFWSLFEYLFLFKNLWYIPQHVVSKLFYTIHWNKSSENKASQISDSSDMLLCRITSVVFIVCSASGLLWQLRGQPSSYLACSMNPVLTLPAPSNYPNMSHEYTNQPTVGKNNILHCVFFMPLLITIMNVAVKTLTQQRECFHSRFSV